MNSLQDLLDFILCISEGTAALIGIYFYNQQKKQYWKYFALYLVIIFLLDCWGRFGSYFFTLPKVKFYNYIVIPFQFIFLYWLFAMKSLKRKDIFGLFSILYILSFIPSELYFKESKVVYSLNYTFGCLLLMILVISEYYKQINSENILLFFKNKMFYVNLGVTLFFIGTLPFYTFYLILYYEHPQIWKIYCYYSQISDNLMYLLFAASFIWGKQSS